MGNEKRMSTTEYVPGNPGSAAHRPPGPSPSDNGAATVPAAPGVQSQDGKADSSLSPGMRHAEGKAVRQAAVRSGMWTIAGFGIMQVLRLAFNLILTRLLVPEIFG